MEKFVLVIVRQNDSGDCFEDESINLTPDNADTYEKRAMAKSVLSPDDFYWTIIRRDYGFGYSTPYIDYQPEFESRYKWKNGDASRNR